MTATILFVDDDEHILEALRRCLRRERFDILTASSGASALEILRTTQVDVIVSDERMPQMSGAELLQYARAESPDTIRILMTGAGSLDETTPGLDACDIYRFLSKPVARDELLRNLLSALQMRELTLASSRLR